MKEWSSNPWQEKTSFSLTSHCSESSHCSLHSYIAWDSMETPTSLRVFALVCSWSTRDNLGSQHESMCSLETWRHGLKNVESVCVFCNGAYRWWSMRDVSSEFIGLLCFVHFSLILQPFWFEHQIMNISKTRLRLTVAGCRWRCNWSWLSSIRISGCRRTWGRVSSYGSAAQPFNPRWDDWRAIGGCHLDCNLKGHQQTNNKQIMLAMGVEGKSWNFHDCFFCWRGVLLSIVYISIGSSKRLLWKEWDVDISGNFIEWPIPSSFPSLNSVMDWGEWSGVEQLCEETSHGREICMLDAGV